MFLGVFGDAWRAEGTRDALLRDRGFMHSLTYLWKGRKTSDTRKAANARACGENTPQVTQTRRPR